MTPHGLFIALFVLAVIGTPYGLFQRWLWRTGDRYDRIMFWICMPMWVPILGMAGVALSFQEGAA